jgi:hypothetical protein
MLIDGLSDQLLRIWDVPGLRDAGGLSTALRALGKCLQRAVADLNRPGFPTRPRKESPHAPQYIGPPATPRRSFPQRVSNTDLW